MEDLWVGHFIMFFFPVFFPFVVNLGLENVLLVEVSPLNIFMFISNINIHIQIKIIMF